jgi:hypothetical protein
MDNEKLRDRERESQQAPQQTGGSRNDDDMRNPLTGETRRSEEQIERDINESEEGGGFAPGGGQPFTG